MLLNSLSIRKLHHTLSLDVDFNDGITLLVGINGSGKTSVLNVIDWLLKPDLRKLALAQYESLELKFEENDKNYVLLARKNTENVTLSLLGTKPPLAPVIVNLVPSDQEGEEDSNESYRGLSPERHEMPMWELLTSFSKPTFISLDRTISAESEEILYVEPRAAFARKRANLRSPITYVQDVTSSRYAEFRIKAIANDNELKANIVMSALQDPEMAFQGDAIKPMTEQEINELEEKVSTFLSATIKSTDVRKQVQRFFHASRLITQRQNRAKAQHDFVFYFIAAQYRQIESLAKAFDDFETKNALAFRTLSGYLLSVNRFFNDSAFASNPKSVFIVDEPELSLHPKWQSEFMDAFLKLRPEETQLLIATHSPDIVGKYKNNCVALKANPRKGK